ncbi:MAG: outer membrane protein assembly factor, partial [Akkermansiaceae bacterium]|nr:outer membrane protein assembly factor [Akkermansiaceae bacterium]
IDYEVTIQGVEDLPALKSLIDKTSLLVTLADNDPETLGALRRRAEGDLPRIRKALNSEGYFNGSASYRIEER